MKKVSVSINTKTNKNGKHEGTVTIQNHNGTIELPIEVSPENLSRIHSEGIMGAFGKGNDNFYEVEVNS